MSETRVITRDEAMRVYQRKLNEANREAMERRVKLKKIQGIIFDTSMNDSGKLAELRQMFIDSFIEKKVNQKLNNGRRK